MAHFRIEFTTPLAPARAWDRLWDLDRHTRFIPFTRVTGGPVHQGTEFVGRTGAGPLGFDDGMVATRFQPPTDHTEGLAHVDKTGRVIQGHIDVAVRAADAGSRITWAQEIRVLGVPAALDPLVSLVAAAGYRGTLRRIVGR